MDRPLVGALMNMWEPKVNANVVVGASTTDTAIDEMTHLNNSARLTLVLIDIAAASTRKRLSSHQVIIAEANRAVLNIIS
ncbi:MAG: hypothetical protein HQL37_15945 [Alphaproteobacteria bacterium]|nr:hypothetical protein [Alphaproteobacteria bacterium]